jgi:hypothetical protein
VSLPSAPDAARETVDEESTDSERYRLVSIEAARAPQGGAAGSWFLYRIAQGENPITGYRCGDRASVSAEVEAIVAALNGRRTWTKSKADSKAHRRAAAARRKAVE